MQNGSSGIGRREIWPLLQQQLSGRGPVDDDALTLMYRSYCMAVHAAARRHIRLKAVRMIGEYWKMREIATAEREQDKLRERLAIHFEDNKPNVREVKNLTRERKSKNWQRMVTAAKGTKEMWSILCCPTTDQSVSTVQIISDNAKTVSQTQKVDGLVRLYLDVGNLKIEKHDRGIKKGLNCRIRSEVCQRLTTVKVILALRSINPTKAAGPDKIHPRFAYHLGPVSITLLTSILNKS